MLKGLSALLDADLLFVLAAMGHGDELAIVDANFPAQAMARRLVRVSGADAAAVLAAVLTVLPVDDFDDAPAAIMAPVKGFDGKNYGAEPFPAILKAAEGREVKIAALERKAFYERAKAAYAIVATAERKLYGNIILRKGVVRPS